MNKIMNNKIYNKLFKIFIGNLFFLFFLINQNAISKPVPPGSGEGDVPANILILLDSSASMNTSVAGGDGLDHPHSIAVDSNGNIYVGEGKQGVMKMLPDATADATFAENNRNFKGTSGDTNCQNGGSNTTLKQVYSMAIDSNDLIYAMGGTNNGKVIVLNAAGVCVDGSMQHSVIKNRPQSITIQQMPDGNDHLWVTGKWYSGSWKATVFTKNLGTGETHFCANNVRYNSNDLTKIAYKAKSTAVSKDGDWMYFANGNIEGFRLSAANSNKNYCPSTTRGRNYVHHNTATNKHGTAKHIQMSKDSNDVMYTTSHRHYVQKLTLTDTGVTRVALAGRNSNISHKTATAGTIASNMVSMKKAHSLAVTSTRIYVGTANNTIQEYDEDKFDGTLYTTRTATFDTSWLKEYGGSKSSRYEGAKEAIRAIVSDSALTSGANFGYGHWNSGEIGSGHKHNLPLKGGKECHDIYNDCVYYGTWDGDHPDGKSSQCNSDSCLLVGIGEHTTANIPAALEIYDLEWGTDGNAFAQMADKYFREKSPHSPDEYMLVDLESDCQLNYIVVIGDGAQKHAAQSRATIKALRHDLGVKTIAVAYGGGITGGPLEEFKKLAIAGSCDAAGDPDCHDLIIASTPEKLKVELQSKIRQIIAERLSFTAPSITATIQKGGSIYQAQFNYEQHGEWQGTILKKAMDANGNVCHDPPDDCPDNWDAGELLNDKGSDARNIWSAIDGVPYHKNWDNWKEDNFTEINTIFELTGVEVVDYHETTSRCGLRGTIGVEDGTDDDIKGLINFVRGKDYFDYDGDCNIAEDRDWILGDIYHSQLIEVDSPNAKTEFTNINQEAFWRKKNNYRGFKSSYKNRESVIYAGGNDGMLHAFKAATGEEMWGFVPPFIASKLPVVVQKDLDGIVGVHKGGGTNPIFAVDGSPVVHDMYIHGLDFATASTFEETKSWRTILFIPYGRGGPGFSVLDVTEPLIKPDKGPMHMFSVFNDTVNNRVSVANHEGVITNYDYQVTSLNLAGSEEARRAKNNSDNAGNTDGADCDSTDTDATNDCTEADAIFACQSNTDATSGSFRTDGDAACFKDNKWTWVGVDLPTNDAGDVDTGELLITELLAGDTKKTLDVTSAQIVNGNLEITFNEDKTYSASDSHLVESTRKNNRIMIATSCDAGGTADKKYDYSQLGETWSTPRIFRIPSSTGDTNLDNDTYVAVMGGGMGVNTLCVGSNLFVVDLENNNAMPGSLFTPDGPIKIVDTDPAGTKPGSTTDNVATPNGSDISNATPASPMVITPDNAKNIPWRGAMVYMNDLEGKITKFNLTNSTKNSAKLFDQATLYNLNAKLINGRFSFHEMDVTLGGDTNNLWLFGSTGNFNRISSTGNKNGDWMQNILYGIRDPHFPYFKHLNGIEVPLYNEAGFSESAAIGANVAPNIDNNDTVDLTGGNEDGSQSLAHGAAKNCKNTTDVTSGCVVSHMDNAWVIYLDEPDGKPIGETSNRFRKASAAPTVFKGHVYFPIYEPDKEDECGLGKAFICSADDECGTNISRHIDEAKFVDSEDCHYVKRGILSKLAVGLDNTLFGNVAGPSENEETLIKILSSSTDVSTYRRSWRENF